MTTTPTTFAYLGQIITHPLHGTGVVIFEEDMLQEEYRTLTVAIGGKFVDALPTRLEEHGYRLTGLSISLPAAHKRLPGHDAVEGWAFDVSEALSALEGRRAA